ncbi:MAG: AAA family ATPase [Humibacillus sp.]|nr:AAA family ATPase [Humibacillus sp.]MDN5778828.1 AAA family ATPase [Humibacillus sp.]
MRTTTNTNPVTETVSGQTTIDAALPAPAPAPDPATAAALFATWSGDPLVLIDSPPGAGKTTLITRLAQQLASRAHLRVAIAGQTRVQAHDLAGRIASLGQPVTLLGGRTERRPAGLHTEVTYQSNPGQLRREGGIVVATTARWLWTATNNYVADVLLVDEAYQITYADLGALAAFTQQLVMVGDPGQIDPVVTGDTTRWNGQPEAPDRPAPHAILAAHGDEQVTRQRLHRSWRLGPATVALIQPAFYPGLPFTSARPEETLTLDGTPTPELTSIPITPTAETDPLICHTVADRVRHLLTGTLTTADGTRPVTAQDIAVITPRVTQSALTAALLADLPDLLIGTANAIQGAERPLAVVVHPLMGLPEVTPFGTDPGRTCVALTRHRAHATVIIDTNTAACLATAATEHPDDTWIPIHQHILEALT